MCALRSEILFQAASSLQIRSCKPEHQRAALSTLEMFAAHFLPGGLELPLLPALPGGYVHMSTRIVIMKTNGANAGLLVCEGHDVTLSSLDRVLEFLGWRSRPEAQLWVYLHAFPACRIKVAEMQIVFPCRSTASCRRWTYDCEKTEPVLGAWLGVRLSAFLWFLLRIPAEETCTEDPLFLWLLLR